MNLKPRLTSILLATGIAGLVAGAAIAAPPPAAKPANAQQTSVAPPEAPKGMKAGKSSTVSVDEVGMGGLVIEFGRTKLEDVRKTAGGSVATTKTSLRYLCYTAETGRRIWVSSDAVGGDTVSAVTLVAQPGMSSEAGCPGLPPRLAPGADIGGVSLGQKRTDVEEQLGHGGGGEWARYETCSAQSKRCSAITLHYVNNRVMQITASQTLAG